MFTFTVNVHHTGPAADAVSSALRDLAARVDVLSRIIRAEGKIMSKQIDDLTAAVKKDTEVESSAVTAIQGLAQQIKDAGGDPAKIAALADQINANADALAAAIVANTPAA